MCRRVFNKTIILLGLSGYEVITTNSALPASLVIHFAIIRKMGLNFVTFQKLVTSGTLVFICEPFFAYNDCNVVLESFSACFWQFNFSPKLIILQRL